MPGTTQEGRGAKCWGKHAELLPCPQRPVWGSHTVPRHPRSRGLATTPGEDGTHRLRLVRPSLTCTGGNIMQLSCPRPTVTRQKWRLLPLRKGHSMHTRQQVSRRGAKAAERSPPHPGVTVPRPHSDHSCVSWRSPLDTDLACVQCSWGRPSFPFQDRITPGASK